MAPSRIPRVTAPADALTAPVLEHLARRLKELRADALAEEERHRTLLDAVHPAHRLSARNLVHYLTLRRLDMRELQAELAWVGLSSLGRTESHAAELLGAPRPHRRVRIVVTIPTEAAHDRALCDALTAAGMDVARINCAHDDPEAWEGTIANLREAAAARGATLRILMDLAGPKLRIDQLIDQPKWAPVVRLSRGDRILLTEVGRGAPEDAPGPFDVHATCPVAEVFRDVRAGDPVWFDDGRVGGHAEETGPGWLRVRVLHAKPHGTKLRSGKGINLPDTVLTLPALRSDDLQALDFAARHADAVALSFVQDESDVVRLHEELAARGRPDLGVVLKIETRAGFENLPRLLLGAMRNPRYGVMIARGDLAVETGFERMAEVQEEILWVAEAAHAPTIWATQVLETLARKGARSRAEVTDAAMSGRAEAVMLNKGAFIVSAIQSLDDILTRMADHQDKKRTLLRPLGISGNL